MNSKELQKLGLIIAIPLFGYAIWSNNQWAEPPKPSPAFEVTIDRAESPKEITVEVENMALSERDLLALCVEAEAGNQSELGKRLVVDVILNRVNDPRFPDTIDDVIKQPGQFAVYESGVMFETIPGEETYRAIELEESKRTQPDIFFFRSGGWPFYGERFDKVGDHYFNKWEGTK